MRRGPLILLSALSLLVLITVLLLWARSYLPHDASVGFRNGRVVLTFAEGYWAEMFDPIEENSPRPDNAWEQAVRHSDRRWRIAGCEYVAGNKGYSGKFAVIAVHFAWLTGAAGVFAAWSFWMLHRATRRLRLNLCRRCGYDLRASTNRCPECGEAVAPPTPMPVPTAPAEANVP